jgi:LacI family transcriptional regulator
LSVYTAPITLHVVATVNRHVQDILGHQRDFAPIVIHFDFERPAPAGLLELARQKRWQLVSVGSTIGQVPPNIDFQGGIGLWLPDHPEIRPLLERGVPMVRIGNWPHPDDALMPAVMPDRPAAGAIAAEHFAQRDFKHVAFVGRQPWSDNEPVYQAFADRAAALGCHCDLLQEHIAQIRSELPPGHNILERRQELFTAWLMDQSKPLGLFTFGDPAAALYCQWVMDAGFHVPEDVAVLASVTSSSTANVRSCRCHPWPLTIRRSARPPGDMLAKLMAGETLPQTTVKIRPTGVVVRRSTDVLAASDPNVVAALRFMWDHVAEDLSVDQIADHLDVSRRTLEKAFQRDLGRSINREFQRRRLEKAKELLLQTDLTVAAIADALSFSSSRQLCRVFAAEFNQSPARYRREHQAAR